MHAPAYRPFDPMEPPPLSSVGWDAWAEEYARLPAGNPSYRFSKDLLYDVIDSELPDAGPLDVLDFNCGCGNDFAHFLDAGHRVLGCDGSLGMLAVGARRFEDAVSSGRLALFHGRAEDLTVHAFGGRRFDAILSATGGTAYLTESQLRRVCAILMALLKPGGCAVVTHLVPRCLVESLYYVLRARPRAALRRWRTTLTVSVRAEPLTMYLRSAGDLRRVLGDVAPPDRVVPLNIVTPPFQTGFRLPDRFSTIMRSAEQRLQRYRFCQAICDQVVFVSRAPQETRDAL